MIQTSSTLFCVKLIVHPLHLVMRQLSHMTLSYLPLERKLVLIYWMMRILKYLTSPIPNSPAGRQLPSQAKRNVWIVAINGEEPITDQGVLDEPNRHQNLRVKSKIKISLCRRNNY